MTDTSKTMSPLRDLLEEALSGLIAFSGDATNLTQARLREVISIIHLDEETKRIDPTPIELAPRDGSVWLVNNTTGDGPQWAPAFWEICGPEWSGWVYDDELLQDALPLGPQPTHFIAYLRIES